MKYLSLLSGLTFLPVIYCSAAVPVEAVIEQPGGEFSACTLILESKDLTLHAFVSFRDGQAQSVAVRGIRHPFLASDIQVVGERVTGRIRDEHPVLGPGEKLTLEIHATVDASGNFSVLGDPETWSPPHPNTTSYGPYMRFPVVDGRMFIRGNDAIYCYDLRKN